MYSEYVSRSNSPLVIRIPTFNYEERNIPIKFSISMHCVSKHVFHSYMVLYPGVALRYRD